MRSGGLLVFTSQYTFEPMLTKGTPTRERIIAAATHLFYSEGVRATSVDAVAEKAGITKKTLYYHFQTKDELITAYLASRDQPSLAYYERWFADTAGSTAEKVRGIFRSFAKSAEGPNWRGCGFLRTIAELASTPGHPAIRVGAAHKKRFEEWMAKTLELNGVGDAAKIARQIVILLDGAATTMLIHRDPAYVELAGEAAAELIERSRPLKQA
ncbi:AcrR family transcriptional regulator [Bradyrhizobium sp. USDA 3686]